MAKQALLERELAEERELALQAERDFLEEAAQRRREAAAFSAELGDRGVTGEEVRRAILVRTLGDAAETVRRVALKLGNLKGTFIRALKEAADGIVEASRELGVLTVTEEVRRLERDNTSLREKVTQLRAEVASIKRNLLERQLQHQKNLSSVGCGGEESVPQSPAKRLAKRGREQMAAPSLPRAGSSAALAPFRPSTASGKFSQVVQREIKIVYKCSLQYMKG